MTTGIGEDTGFDPEAVDSVVKNLHRGERVLGRARVDEVEVSPFGDLPAGRLFGQHASTAWRHVDEGFADMQAGLDGLAQNVRHYERDLTGTDERNAGDLNRRRADLEGPPMPYQQAEDCATGEDFTGDQQCTVPGQGGA